MSFKESFKEKLAETATTGASLGAMAAQAQGKKPDYRKIGRMGQMANDVVEKPEIVLVGFSMGLFVGGAVVFAFMFVLKLLQVF